MSLLTKGLFHAYRPVDKNMQVDSYRMRMVNKDCKNCNTPSDIVYVILEAKSNKILNANITIRQQNTGLYIH